jgi:hypothetical protein
VRTSLLTPIHLEKVLRSIGAALIACYRGMVQKKEARPTACAAHRDPLGILVGGATSPVVKDRGYCLTVSTNAPRFLFGNDSAIAAKFGRDGGIRTHDPLTPSQVRYQAALHPESASEADQLQRVPRGESGRSRIVAYARGGRTLRFPSEHRMHRTDAKKCGENPAARVSGYARRRLVADFLRALEADRAAARLTGF